ncbi:hypothetical protein ACMT9Y_14255 [Clavibacter tessellarius]|uniref:hypothetical protein n=1 Tax=Clavibacter tessellarius TaxID=31965 RepID=UPI0039ED474D
MRSRGFLNGMAAGGLFATTVLGSPSTASQMEMEPIVDGLESVVTPAEKREEQEAWEREAGDAAHEDAPALEENLPQPDALGESRMTSIDVDVPEETSARQGGEDARVELPEGEVGSHPTDEQMTIASTDPAPGDQPAEPSDEAPSMDGHSSPEPSAAAEDASDRAPVAEADAPDVDAADPEPEW